VVEREGRREVKCTTFFGGSPYLPLPSPPVVLSEKNNLFPYFSKPVFSGLD
jgi:hypothetical protein